MNENRILIENLIIDSENHRFTHEVKKSHALKIVAYDLKFAENNASNHTSLNGLDQDILFLKADLQQ